MSQQNTSCCFKLIHQVPQLKIGQLQLPYWITLSRLKHFTIHYFDLSIQSPSALPISVKIVDIKGRIIKMLSDVPPRSTLKLGHNFRPGIYFIETTQGHERVQLKMLKL